MTILSVTAIRTAPSGMPRPGKVLVRGARAAAEGVVRRNKVRIHMLGRYVDLPSGQQLVFLAGLGLLTVLEFVEWPVALVLAVGHVLAEDAHNRLLRQFGAALEEA